MSRYGKCQQLMKELGVDAIIMSNAFNMRYFSGFTGAEGYYYCSLKTRALIVDSRYKLWAESECKDCTVLLMKDSFEEILNSLIRKDGVDVVALESLDLSYNDYQKLERGLSSKRFFPLQQELEALRMVKSAAEIDKIYKAEQIGDRAFDYILNRIRPGITEKEVALDVEFFMRSHGASALSFDVIVASGVNSAKPHAIPSDKVLERGDFLTMDFGCIYEGYCSDMTRTVVIGKADQKQKEVYELVLRAQEEALTHLKAGITGSDADSYARSIINEAGYGECFGHGLGHSVGLEIHESPRLSDRKSVV